MMSGEGKDQERTVPCDCPLSPLPSLLPMEEPSLDFAREQVLSCLLLPVSFGENTDYKHIHM